MLPVTNISVFYRKDNQVQCLTSPPSDQEIAAIKLEVARMVKRIKDEGGAEYYYVVVEVRRSDGSCGYRTVVPKTLI